MGCIFASIGGAILEAEMLDPKTALGISPRLWFLGGFLFCSGAFLVAGFPAHSYLKKRNLSEYKHYAEAGMLTGAIYGAVAGLMLHYFGHVQYIARPMFGCGIMGLIGGFLCSTIFWSSISRNFLPGRLAGLIFFMGILNGLVDLLHS
jgi:hypothetical protein